MLPFQKVHVVIIALTVLVVSSLTFYNLQTSLRRARDFQRKEDINLLSKGLLKFYEDYGFYPKASSDGRIVACKAKGAEVITDKKIVQNSYIPCDWGVDSLRDITDESYPAYIERIPVDPGNDNGIKYRYDSSGRFFQILTSLEGHDEDEFEESINVRGISCGVAICNFGRASNNTPLDKSIQEYENELEEIRRLELSK